MQTVRWGIIGCGWVARDYVAPAILATANADLVAVCDLHQNAVENISRNHPGIARHTNLQSFLNTCEIDAVYIATPNDSHRAMTVAAASAGKHVFCEKPMAHTLLDADAMVRACRENNVRYATAFDQRFHPYHQLLRQWIQQRRLGVISSIRIHYACWLPPDWTADNWRVQPERAGGGAFIDLAPHGIDLIQFLLDDNFVETTALFQQRVFPYVVDDGAMLIGKLSGGCLFNLHVSYNCPESYPRRTLEVIGTEGRVLASNTMGQTPGGTLQWMDRAGQVTEISGDTQSPFEKQITAYSQCILDEVPFPFSPQRDLKTMKIIASVQQTAQQNVEAFPCP